MLAARLRGAACALRAGRGLSQLTSVVTDADRETYARDGVVCVRGAFADWVEKLRGGAEVNMAAPGPLVDEHVPAGEPGRFHDDQFLWRRHALFRDFIFNSQAAALACAVTGSKGMHVFYDQLFVKEPGTRTATPWHTDHSYWQLAGGQVTSLWLALDFVPGQTAVRYAAGSHKWALKHQIKSFSGDQARYAATTAAPPLPDMDALEAKGEVQMKSWDLQPGDVVIFDSYSVHGSPGNSSNSLRRRAYSTRWASDEVRFDARPSTMHHTWVSKGFDCQLAHGATLQSDLHPLIPLA